MIKKVTSQQELDDAVAAGHQVVVHEGEYEVAGSATVRAYGSATVWAYGSATVRAYGSATVWAAFPKSGTSRIRVLHCIAFAGNYGRTDQELEERLGLPRPTAGNSRGELVKGGWVRDSGERRLTRAGNPAVVWVLTEAGQSAYRDRRGITR